MNRIKAQKITKAIADATRFDVFRRIAARQEMACADLKERLPITAATLSHHIKELANAGLIECRQQGKFMYLAANRGTWRTYVRSLKNILQKP